MDKSIADLIDGIITDRKKFAAFCFLISLLVGLGLLMVWLVPKILHLSTSKLTISAKGSEIELRSSTADQDQYYLVVSPQASWQPTHIYFKKGDKLRIVADGRVNIDSHGLNDEIEKRICLEKRVLKSHPQLRSDPNHTPEEYFSVEDWKSLVPPHYWSDPEGDKVISDSSFSGRQKYKIAPKLSFGALIGTVMMRDDVDSNGQPPPLDGEIFLVGRRWPHQSNDDSAPATGYLWLAINDVVEPEQAFPNAKGVVRLSDVFLLDNQGFYRVVVELSH